MSTYKDGNKPRNPVSYAKAMKILPKLLEGEKQIVISLEENISERAVTSVKRMFPLFFHNDFRKQ